MSYFSNFIPLPSLLISHPSSSCLHEIVMSLYQTGWVLPDTCVNKDCKLSDPLPLSKLSPNLLLVLIHASAGGRDKRDVIRDTWLSGMSNKDNSPIQYRSDLFFIEAVPVNGGVCINTLLKWSFYGV